MIQTKAGRLEKIEFFFEDKKEIFNLLQKNEEFDCGDYCDYCFHYRDEKSLVSLLVEHDGTLHFNYQSLEYELPEHQMCCLNDEDPTNIINIFYLYLKYVTTKK